MIDIENAIKYFDGYGSPYDDLVISALEKQIPKKVKGEDYPYCPNCDSSSWLHNADEEENEYCGKCGQKLDWSVEE